ncbi:HepT-like ribonuclease domain-containing protein [Haloimpatiens lingqiaonensis]|uniref:HepT-like ribonuclease domain-containing protein n=1 Tax=Haloimpatiens lingqiaonensis TaxID=1380675 RepID=UPI0010FE292D|nr:HepT-like ribonuclease domain-containing protein [Haloimpatiens lingqiaonensis]
MINRDRILKLVGDFNELETDIRECIKAIEGCTDEKLKKMLYHSVRAYFLDFHILCEDYISINLKKINKFKIDMSAIEGMEVLKNSNKVTEDFFRFYTISRRLRNRLAHRYKMPTDEELFESLKTNLKYFSELRESIRGVYYG